MTEKKRKGIYERFIKRLMDIVISAASIVCMSPCYLVIAVMVRVKMGSPVIFEQERPGKDEKIFKMYKFRTMNNARDISGELLPDTARLTNLGRLLRSSSLDELPELFNILKGDMSLVGPRPLAAVYLPYYTDEERQRHDVRPGLTGLAQINGRNAISWEEKFRYDLEYVNNITFINDVKILWRTFFKVARQEDIGQDQEAPLSLHIERKGRENEHYRK